MKSTRFPRPSPLSANDRARVEASTEEGEPSELAVELLDLAAPRGRRDLRQPHGVTAVAQLYTLLADNALSNAERDRDRP